MPCVHISTKELRPGMYIVATAATWQDRPFLYAKAGLIKSDEEIKSIIEQGYVETYYDPEKSCEHPENIKKNNDLISEQALTELPKAKPLAEELKVAKSLYDDCLKQINVMLEDVRHGKVDVAASKSMVINLIASINRNQDALTSLAKVKTHDEYTFVHSINVAIFSIAFGRSLGFDEERLNLLGLSAICHDFGKMRIPKKILDAPRPLTPQEFAVIRTHPQLGVDLLQTIPNTAPEIIEGVLDHHEKYNGQGYPGNKKGSEISPFGRIISISDIYDALSSTTVYRKALTPNRALTVMYGMRDEFWEPSLCDRFVKFLGIYPVGSCVSLTMGYKGIVSQSNYKAPLYPTVLLTKAPDGKSIRPPKPIDLSKQHDLQIIKALPPEELDKNIIDVILDN